ncbi:MAG: hypothetical protein NZM33_05615 [Bryobacteraceae bacterium]|nr:hypothetical protein [Bryobacteraceae bacterium]
MRIPVGRILGSGTWGLLWVHLAIAAPFGTVVTVGGHVSDVALDERRGLLYAANFTANRIEVISTRDYTRRGTIALSPQPAALALSPDARFLVVAHFSKWAPPASSYPAVTVVDLEGPGRRVLAFPPAEVPLAVAFGASPQALVATTRAFYLLEPFEGTITKIYPQSWDIERPLDGRTLPVPIPTFPAQIVQAAAGVSGDGRFIWMLAKADSSGDSGSGAGSSSSVRDYLLRYEVSTQQLLFLGVTAHPPLGPRVVSVNRDGSLALIGWGIFNSRGVVRAQFPYPLGDLHRGGHGWEERRGLIYAHLPAAADEPPVLTVFEADNLTVRERLQLREGLSGRVVFSSDGSTLYAASDSGVTILPLGSLSQAHRVVANREDVLFRVRGCDWRPMVEELELVNPGGGATPFRLRTTAPGVRLEPSMGLTPARVRIHLDPMAYQNRRGTITADIEILSEQAVNIPPKVRLLVNVRDADQRGEIVSVPGKLVDILADPVRDRFYVLRQDQNQVLVFDGSTLEPIARLRTGNTPVQMAFSLDHRLLLVGNDNSQLVSVFDLDRLEAREPVEFPSGHYPRSVAVSRWAIWAAVRSMDLRHAIDRIHFDLRHASTPPSLGIYQNDIDDETILLPSVDRGFVFAAMRDGRVLLYDAHADTFVVARKDFESLSGAVAAVGEPAFLVENRMLNGSLVPEATLDSTGGSSSGFAIADGWLVRTISAGADQPGLIQRLHPRTFELRGAVSLAEAPLVASAMASPPVGQTGQTILPFTRTLAALSNRRYLVSLSRSGLLVVPWDFDAPSAAPVVSAVVNAADHSPGVAPGGLISIQGRALASTTAASRQTPLPTVLGGVCVAVNDRALPLLLVSEDLIQAQLPDNLTGPARLVVRAPGGNSAPLDFQILPAAPAIFRLGEDSTPAIVRARNNQLVTLTNPVHPKDVLTIYATGLGAVTPPVSAGEAAPIQPLSSVVLPPSVTLGGAPLPVHFAGLAPGQVGLYQINVSVTDQIPEGMSVPLRIEQAGASTTVNVRVVKP